MKPWQAIWRTIRHVPWLWIGNMIGISVIFVSFQVPGLVNREFFNTITGEAPANIGIWTMVALIVAGGFGRLFGIVCTVGTNIPLQFRIAALLQKNMLGRVLGLPGARALNGSPGEAISRFRGDVDEMRFFPLRMNDWVAGVANGAISIAVMVWINPYIAMVALAPIAVVMVIVYFAKGRIEEYRKRARETAGRVTGYIGDLFGAVQAVKVGTAEGSMIEHFRSLNAERSKTALQDRLFSELLDSVFRNAVNISTAVIMLLAAQSMQSGKFTVGDFSLFVYYLPGLAEMTWMMGSILAKYKQIDVSLERMQKVMQGAPLEDLVAHGPIFMNEDEPRVPQVERDEIDRLEHLEVRDLTFRYPDGGKGIEGVDLALARGSFTVITGRIGAGKTTLVRVLLGLLPRDRGEIAWNGRPIEDPATFFVPPQSAYTPQVPWLYSASLRDNLLMGIEEDRVDVDAAIRSAVLEGDLADLDEGLETVVGPKGVRLSGGQMQRAAAARMFVRDPELLVFDDLSSALDVNTERTLWERMFERRGTESEKTCLVVSHRRPALRHADQIVVLKDGHIDGVGILSDLLETNEEMQRLWRGQQQ